MTIANQSQYIRNLMSLREHRAEVFSLLVQYFVVLSFVMALVLPLKLAFSLAAILLAIARYFLLLLREAKKQRERLEAGLLAESAVCEMTCFEAFSLKQVF